jgi:hypothetical protein
MMWLSMIIEQLIQMHWHSWELTSDQAFAFTAWSEIGFTITVISTTAYGISSILFGSEMSMIACKLQHAVKLINQSMIQSINQSHVYIYTHIHMYRLCMGSIWYGFWDIRTKLNWAEPNHGSKASIWAALVREN